MQVNQMTKKYRSRLQKLETAITNLEERRKRLYTVLALPETYDDYEKYRELLARNERLDRKLEAKYREWEELTAKVEGIVDSDSGPRSGS